MLKDRFYIVTGSSSGIGWAIAQAIHNEGGAVLLHGTDEGLLKERATTLGGQASWIAADLRQGNAAERIASQAIEVFGQIDGLVNCAGVMTRNTLGEISADLFDEIIAINTRAPLLLCRQAIKHFLKQGNGGNIVNIGSINAYCGQTNNLIYSMSKGAMQTMTRNLGDAHGKDRIRVNQLNVGWTWTENEHQIQLGEGRDENWLEQIPDVFAPFGTILRPEQIAEHVLFWLSDKSHPISGQVYEVEQYPLIGRNKINQS